MVPLVLGGNRALWHLGRIVRRGLGESGGGFRGREEGEVVGDRGEKWTTRVARAAEISRGILWRMGQWTHSILTASGGRRPSHVARLIAFIPCDNTL